MDYVKMLNRLSEEHARVVELRREMESLRSASRGTKKFELATQASDLISDAGKILRQAVAKLGEVVAQSYTRE